MIRICKVVIFLTLFGIISGNAAENGIAKLEKRAEGIEQIDPHFAEFLRHEFDILRRLQIDIETDRRAGKSARAASEAADFERMVRKLGEEIDFVKSAPDLKRNGRLNVRDFGAKGDGVTDDTAAIHKAIQTALAGEVRWVFLPRGSYLVRRHPELESQFNQWGETEGFKVIDDHHPANAGAIVIHGRDLLLSGEEGTELLVDSPQESAIQIVGSNNIRITDLKIRYTKQLNVSGRIVALHGTDSIDVELEPGSADPREAYFHERGFCGLCRFLSENHRTGDSGRPEFSNAAIHQAGAEVTHLRDRIYRFRFHDFLPVQNHYRVGMHITYYARPYSDHAVCNYLSDRTRLERICLTSSPAIAFYSLNCDMPFFIDCKVEPEPGRWESTNADGFYFKSGFGGYVTGSRLLALGDDFFNIHGRMAPIVRQEGNTLWVQAKIWPERYWREFRRLALVRTSQGDCGSDFEFEIKHWELVPPSQPGGMPLVKVVCGTELPPHLAVLEDPATGNAPDVLIMPDTEWFGLVIAGNHFEHGVSRILPGGRNIDISNNTFLDSLESHGLVMAGLESISRSGGEARFPRNILLADNRFESKAKTILLFSSPVNSGMSGGRNLVHFDIIGNTFSLYGDSELPVVKLCSAEDVSIRDNYFQATGKMTGPVFEQMANCSAIEIGPNDVSDAFPLLMRKDLPGDDGAAGNGR